MCAPILGTSAWLVGEIWSDCDPRPRSAVREDAVEVSDKRSPWHAWLWFHRLVCFASCSVRRTAACMSHHDGHPSPSSELVTSHVQREEKPARKRILHCVPICVLVLYYFTLVLPHSLFVRLSRCMCG